MTSLFFLVMEEELEEEERRRLENKVDSRSSLLVLLDAASMSFESLSFAAPKSFFLVVVVEIVHTHYIHLHLADQQSQVQGYVAICK